MPAKIIKVSDDAGANYYTLPGNTGEFSDELGVLDDTVFGQNFKSGQSGLINWGVSANALYKGFAGYLVSIKKPGTGTAMTTEAHTLVSGKTYKISNATKNVWDRSGTFIVYDNGVDRTNTEVLNIDYLFGQVTFKSSYTVVGPVTVTGKYFPMTSLAKYRGFNLTMSQDPIENTDVPTASANSGHRTNGYGLKTVSLDVNGVYATANGYRADLVARTELMIEIDPGNALKALCRGFFKPAGRNQSGRVGALEEESVSFVLSVPDVTLMKTPFRWEFSATTDISTAVRKCIEAWQNETTMRWQYLWDGTTGFQGDGVITDVSLSGGLEAMNEFSASLAGSGIVTAI